MKGFALSLVSKVKVYGTRQKLPIVDKSLIATAQASPEGRGGGVLLGILGGGVPDPISDKKMSFSIPVFRPCL